MRPEGAVYVLRDLIAEDGAKLWDDIQGLPEGQNKEGALAALESVRGFVADAFADDVKTAPATIEARRVQGGVPERTADRINPWKLVP